MSSVSKFKRSLLPSIIQLVVQLIVWSQEVTNEAVKQVIGNAAPWSIRDEPHPFFHATELMISASDLVECILTSQSSYRCIQNYRMNPQQFMMLCQLLQPHLKETKKLPVMVQVAIFLDWVSHGSTLRKQKETFKISHELLEKARVGVATAVVKVIYPRYVKYCDRPPDLSNDPKFKRFQGVFGCIDGSHIPIIVPVDKHRRWRNRKGFTSTNTMLVCDVKNMLFQYALFGNEGCGSDSIIFKTSAQHMRWLKDGFLLADAGYGLCKKLLTPYRGVRYHLREFARSKKSRPKDAKELYNLRHSSMRIIIERCFGVLKNRFRILQLPLQLARPKLMWTVLYACVALHNFIRIVDPSVDKDIELQTQRELDEQMEDENEKLKAKSDLLKTKESETWRDNIANQMWEDYQQELRRRERRRR